MVKLLIRFPIIRFNVALSLQKLSFELKICCFSILRDFFPWLWTFFPSNSNLWRGQCRHRKQAGKTIWRFEKKNWHKFSGCHALWERLIILWQYFKMKAGWFGVIQYQKFVTSFMTLWTTDPNTKCNYKIEEKYPVTLWLSTYFSQCDIWWYCPYPKGVTYH